MLTKIYFFPREVLQQDLLKQFADGVQFKKNV